MDFNKQTMQKSILLRTILFWACLIACSSSWAQDAFFADFYRQFSQHSRSGVEISFRSQVLGDAQMGDTPQNGTLWIKGKKLRLSVGASEAIYDTEAICVKDDDEKTLTYMKPNQEDLLALSPLVSVGADTLFKTTFLEEKGDRRLYKLTPKQKMGIAYFVLAIHKTQKTPRYIVAVYSNGMRVVNTISRYGAKTLNESFFQFSSSRYAQYEKVDLR